jgi:predicted transposase/invertase (TIGR01784 family)
MPTLAQRLRDEGEREGRREGKREEKFKIARRLLMDDWSVEKVASITGLTETEVKSVMN